MMTPDGSVFVPRYKDPKTGKIKDQKVTNKIVCGHLNGHYSICVYGGSASSKFVCFDVDDGNPQTVWTIVDILSKVGFPRERIYVSTSGGKGFHVEMFFSSLMFTSDLKNIYNYVCATGKLDTAKVEFRPTKGQSIKLPLSIHRKTGNTCWYLDQKTLEPIKSQEYIMEIEKIPHELALKIAKALPAYGYTMGYEREKIPERELSLDELNAFVGDCYPDLTAQGKRNSLMVQIAVHNRYRGLDKAMCEMELQKWYHRQNPAFINSDEGLVESEILKILDWAYSDRFVLGKHQTKIVFRQDDLRMLLAQRKRSDRLILFVVQYYTKAYGSCCLSMNRISEITGLAVQTVFTSTRNLVDNKWIDIVSQSSARKTGDGYQRTANRYRVSESSYSWAAGQFEYIPGVSLKTQTKIFSALFMRDEFSTTEDHEVLKTYRDVLCAFLDEKSLQHFLAKKEYETLKETDNQ